MTVQFGHEAEEDLYEVWEWNAHRHGHVRANDYRSFLLAEIDKLADDHALGRSVGQRGLRYVTIRRRPSAQGHVVVYAVGENRIVVARVFHTAQDWRTRLEEL